MELGEIYTALVMADLHIDGMVENPVVKERQTFEKARVLLQAMRKRRLMVGHVVVNIRLDYPNVSDRDLGFREKSSGLTPACDSASA